MVFARLLSGIIMLIFILPRLNDNIAIVLCRQYSRVGVHPKGLSSNHSNVFMCLIYWYNIITCIPRFIPHKMMSHATFAYINIAVLAADLTADNMGAAVLSLVLNLKCLILKFNLKVQTVSVN